MASDSLHTVIRLFEKYIQPLHRQTARMFPPSAPPDFPKAFGRCRRGRSPSDFHSYPAALPTGRVVDFACKINSLQIQATSGWLNLLPRKSGENHFCDTLTARMFPPSAPCLKVHMPYSWRLRSPVQNRKSKNSFASLLPGMHRPVDQTSAQAAGSRRFRAKYQ